MRRIIAVVGAVVVLVGAISVVAWATKPEVAKLKAPVTFTVIEHATTDVGIDTDRNGGDSTGDLLTWHNRIFGPANKYVVGRDQGDCIRIDPAAGTWECRWITWVPGGALTVEGPFYDTHDNSLAITGGLGRYRNAQGTMFLKARKGGAEYAFTFHVIPG
jgi:allene oxide cyclase